MDTNKKPETNFSSFDEIDKKIHANQVLYDQLHQSLVDEVISTAEENDEKQKRIASKKNSEKNYLIKIKEFYQSNELFKYAMWGFGAVLLATT